MKFGHLILRKIFKFVAIRRQILRLKCTKFDFFGKHTRVATDAALLLVNRLKTNIFFVNVPLKLLSPEAFFSQKCTKYRLAAGLCPDRWGIWELEGSNFTHI